MAILYTKFYQNSSRGARTEALGSTDGRQAGDTWPSVREAHGVYLDYTAQNVTMTHDGCSRGLVEVLFRNFPRGTE